MHTGSFFYRYDALLNNVALADPCIAFQIAMEENALQFVNGTILPNIKEFIANATSVNLRLLVRVPVLYAVADHEFVERAGIHPTTLGVFRWIFIRAFVVLQQLMEQGSGPTENTLSQADMWQKVFIFHRNQFIKLTNCFSKDRSVLWNAPNSESAEISQPSP